MLSLLLTMEAELSRGIVLLECRSINAMCPTGELILLILVYHLLRCHNILMINSDLLWNAIR